MRKRACTVSHVMISNLLICRFEGALNHAKHLHSTLCRSTLNESQYLWNVEDLRKVRKEVDLLGDEVESLVTMVEKVYKVLDHHGVIPHPGVLVVKLNPML
jgi:hypothetical protein